MGIYFLQLMRHSYVWVFSCLRLAVKISRIQSIKSIERSWFHLSSQSCYLANVTCQCVFISIKLRHLMQRKVTTARCHRVLGHSDRLFVTFASCTSLLIFLLSGQEKRSNGGESMEGLWNESGTQDLED